MPNVIRLISHNAHLQRFSFHTHTRLPRRPSTQTRSNRLPRAPVFAQNLYVRLPRRLY